MGSMARKSAIPLAVLHVLVMSACAASAAEAAGDTAAMPAAQTDSLYRSIVVVTGTEERNRIAGFAQCLGDVLVKLTGDQTTLKDRRFPGIAAKAGTFVQSFSYRDRLEGKPYHDEQGTHDRPHDLTVTFDHAKIDALARSLGREPWLGPRPRVVVFLGVENMRAKFMLASDSIADRSDDMRAAFTAASEKAAIPLAFPMLTQLEAHGWTAKSLPGAALADARAIAHDNGGDVAVIGSIVFSEQALGWVARWRMEDHGKAYVWGARGVNFDAAFRDALFGAAQILSGHGKPE